jgi:prenyl protein peptidase
MGYYPLGLDETIKTLLLTAIPFAGPLFEAGIAEGGWRDWIRLRGVNETIRGWIGWRNYVAVSVIYAHKLQLRLSFRAL